MTSARIDRFPAAVPFRMRRLALLLLVLFTLSWPLAGSAAGFRVPEVSNEGAEAWLVTFGPGEVYWERFGHNAIWLREPALGLDHTFNFGFFDFEQEDFFLRFLKGRMLYFSVAQPAAREFEFYRGDNRSIRLQKLNLTRAQYQSLRDYLVNEIKPENRDYRYDYYLSNCSTRIRDAIDDALGGVLADETKMQPAQLDFRRHTRRLTQMQFWYYLGLEFGLGKPVDREISRWDEMFVPMVVADELATLRSGGVPFVAVDAMLYESTAPPSPAAPTPVWHRYLLLGLLIAGLAWLSGRFMPPVWADGLSLSWLLINSTMGMVLAGLWLLTDHEVARSNANLLLLNPLLILALVPVLRKLGAFLLAGGVLIAVLLLLLPNHQYNLDVLALLAPINLAVARYLQIRTE